LIRLRFGKIHSLHIADFGFSRTIEKGQLLNTFRGTPGFIAPEVYSGVYSEKSDIWSFGMILYEVGLMAVFKIKVSNEMSLDNLI